MWKYVFRCPRKKKKPKFNNFGVILGPVTSRKKERQFYNFGVTLDLTDQKNPKVKKKPKIGTFTICVLFCIPQIRRKTKGTNFTLFALF